MKRPEISLILSAYHRPKMLFRVLADLMAQTFEDFECIVTDNSTDDGIAAEQRKIVKRTEDRRFRYMRTVERTDGLGVVTKGRIQVSDCYWSAEYGARSAKGTWLGFPCDDTQYVDEYLARMLSAAVMNNWQFVIAGKALVGPLASVARSRRQSL